MTKIVALLGLVLGASVYAAALRQTSLPEREIADRPISVNADGFTSSQTCQACHPSQYNTWRTSYHRTMNPASNGNRAFDHGRPPTPCCSRIACSICCSLRWTRNSAVS